MPLSEGWRDQYERMLRSHQALVSAAGPSDIEGDDARDALYHFFQDAYHLKEWIENSPTSHVHTAKAGAVVEAELFDPVSGLPHMQIAADVCHSIKHLRLDYLAKTGDQTTTIASQDVAIGLPAFVTSWEYPGAPSPPKPEPETAKAEFAWKVTSNQRTWDALDLADQVVAEWERWLTDHKLLP